MANDPRAMRCYIGEAYHYPTADSGPNSKYRPHAAPEPLKSSLPARGTPRKRFLSPFSRPLSILLATAAAFTCVRSQSNPIQIKVAGELTECIPSNITWRGGTPPYTLGLSIGSFSNGASQTFSNISTMFFVWSTNIAAPNTVQFAVSDGATIDYSTFVGIIAGLSDSCLSAPLDPFTSSSGGANPSTKTQASGTTNTAGSSSSGSSQSLSPDVIGIIVAVAVVLVAVVLWILYKRSTRRKPDLVLAAPAPTLPAMAQYPAPPMSPIVRPTSILSASPTGTYSPSPSPAGGALQLSPYGHPPPPAAPWQSAASIHTTHTQYYVGPGSPAPRAPVALPWAGYGQDAGGVGEQGRRLSAGHAAGGTVVSDEGSDSWRALISPPQARRS